MPEDENLSDDENNDVKKKTMTPLHWSSYKGHLNCVWLLISAGFDPLEVDDFGNNSFHHAASGGHYDLLEC